MIFDRLLRTLPGVRKFQGVRSFSFARLKPGGDLREALRRKTLRALAFILEHPWFKSETLLRFLPHRLRSRIPPDFTLPPLEPEGAILPQALIFQGALTHLIQEPLPPALRGTIHYMGGAIGIALLISIFCKVDVVVSGQGKLTNDGPPIVLQPFERAVLRSLNVKPGDRVTKGQILATLDSTFSQADLSALDSRLRQTRAQLRRLEQEAAGALYEPDPADGDAALLQSEIFKLRSAEKDSRLKAFVETLGETQSAIDRTRSDISNLEEQLAISQQMEEMQERLFKFKTNSQVEFLAAKSSRLRAEREHRESVERLSELKHRLETVQANKEGFLQEWRRALAEELAKQRAEYVQLESSLTKMVRVNNLIVFSAPEDAVVLDIANRSVGSVLREAEPLVVLIPTMVPMIAEIQLGSSAVGEAAVGDAVLVKVDAFPFQRYGGIKGRIRSISYDSHAGGASGDLESVANKRTGSGGGMHWVAIELESNRMERIPKNRGLFPGMTVGAEIHLGKRRIIQYILLPLFRGLRESFREP